MFAMPVGWYQIVMYPIKSPYFVTDELPTFLHCGTKFLFM